jgi:hypothetical protein
MVVSSVACVIACIWFVEPDAAYTGYFRQDIPEKNNCYYSYFNFYDSHTPKEIDKKQNIREWKKHLGGNVAEADIENLLYGIPLQELWDICNKAVAGKWSGISGKWAKNGMMQRIIRLRDLNTLNYLLYAKSCEPHAWRETENWNYTPSPDMAARDSLLNRGIELYRKSRPEFTKLRYAFQIVRMAYYCNRYEDCTEYYREMIAPEEKSGALAKLWALAFYAGSVDTPEEAAYHYSTVFDRCPRYSSEAMTSFRWLINTVDTAWITGFCKNDYEKAVVHAMAGFTCFHPTLEPLRHVHDLCPAIPYMETLLIREINKIEDGLSGGDTFLDPADPNRDDIRQHASELKDLAIRYAGLREVAQSALWYTAAAYLACLLEEFEQASLLIDIAAREQLAPKVAEQLHVVRLLVETSATEFDESTEDRILPSLQWLLKEHQEKKDSLDGYSFFDRTLAHYFAEKLTGLYIVAGDPVKAALCTSIAVRYSDFVREHIFDINAFSILDNHASIHQLEEMLQNTANVGNISRAFDAFLYSHSDMKEDVLRELIGTKHLRLLHFEEAARNFEQLSDTSRIFHTGCDPFAEPPLSGGRNCGHSDDMPCNFKLNFAKEMAALQTRIQTKGKALPEDLYRYANGLYQMSWYGNSWTMLSYYRSCHDPDKWRETGESDEWYHFHRLEPARDCYLQAFENARDKEFKARCLFMASHCYRMNAPPVYIFHEEKYIPGEYLRNNPYFASLWKKYRKTDFYKEALTRCSSLADFVELDN